MNKLTKVKLFVFLGIILIASFSYIFHILPYTAIWLWFPILVFVNHWLDWYAERRGMILSDEMTRQRTGVSSWWTFQATIALIFLSIVYYDSHRTSIDPRFILAYLAGFMGIIFLAVYAYYNFKQGVWE
ncbi:MAG: hypothetical protein ACE5HY_05160 [Candidatus Hydrothermarchaeales archaeon]